MNDKPKVKWIPVEHCLNCKRNSDRLIDYYLEVAQQLQKSLKDSEIYLGSDYKLRKINNPEEVLV